MREALWWSWNSARTEITARLKDLTEVFDGFACRTRAGLKVNDIITHIDN